jgi:nuclear pore complex protein Nup160
LYLQFDLLNEAGMVASQYVSAVLGKGKEYFGLKNAVHANQPAVWLPYTVLEQLIVALERMPTGSTEVELGAKLRTHLSEYEKYLERASQEMITHGRKKGDHLNIGGFGSRW